MTFSAAALTAFAAAAASASASALVSGDLDFLDSGGAILATADLGTPAASGAVTTMGGYPRTVAGTAGTIASARYRTSAGVEWKTGITVGLSGSGAQVILSSLTIGAGQSVFVSSATLTHSGTSA
jgi:hypothetical protein